MKGVDMRSRFDRFSWVTVSFALVLTLPTLATAQTRGNPLCPGEDVFFNPGHGQDIVVPTGFEVSVFAKGLNFPTAVAFRGDAGRFEVFVLESGHGLPSRCNDETSAIVGGELSAANPFTPDILVFDQSGKRLRGPLAKPTAPGVGLQAHGPAIDIAFENGFAGGRLFATDSNQAIRAVGAQNNSSRIVTVNPQTGQVTPFISGLPTGDHPAEQITFKGGWIYWSQGSTTNSSVVGRDNGGGANQQDIPCQDITLSTNLFDTVGRIGSVSWIRLRRFSTPSGAPATTMRPQSSASRFNPFSRSRPSQSRRPCPLSRRTSRLSGLTSCRIPLSTARSSAVRPLPAARGTSGSRKPMAPRKRGTTSSSSTSALRVSRYSSSSSGLPTTAHSSRRSCRGFTGSTAPWISSSGLTPAPT